MKKIICFCLTLLIFDSCKLDQTQKVEEGRDQTVAPWDQKTNGDNQGEKQKETDRESDDVSNDSKTKIPDADLNDKNSEKENQEQDKVVESKPEKKVINNTQNTDENKVETISMDDVLKPRKELFEKNDKKPITLNMLKKDAVLGEEKEGQIQFMVNYFQYIDQRATKLQSIELKQQTIDEATNKKCLNHVQLINKNLPSLMFSAYGEDSEQDESLDDLSEEKPCTKKAITVSNNVVHLVCESQDKKLDQKFKLAFFKDDFCFFESDTNETKQISFFDISNPQTYQASWILDVSLPELFPEKTNMLSASFYKLSNGMVNIQGVFHFVNPEVMEELSD